MARKVSRANLRPEGWSADWLISHLENSNEDKVSITALCKQYAGKGWHRMYTEVMRWRRENRVLDELIKLKRLSSNGRPKKEMSDDTANWRIEYVNELLLTGDRTRAAEKTPFTTRRIRHFLDQNNPDYDEHFHSLVKDAEQKICAEMEAGMIQAFREAELPRDRAWIARTFLERMDPTRWGKQVELIHSGNISHNHKHTHEIRPRKEILLELFEDQRMFFNKVERLELPAKPIDIEWKEVEKVRVDEST